MSWWVFLFIEGKHYYKLQGEELKEFKRLLVENEEPLYEEIKFAPVLILWTKRGQVESTDRTKLITFIKEDLGEEAAVESFNISYEATGANGVRHTYYKSSKFKLTIVKQTRSTTHKQRREVLSELKQTYYNIYNKNHIVMLI